MDKSNNDIKIEKTIRIGLIGMRGVGKTTIFNLLTDAKKSIIFCSGSISQSYLQNSISNLFKNTKCLIRDPHQKLRFFDFWDNFMDDLDIAILITDSQKENVIDSKFYMDLIKKNCPKAKLLVIANKQDLPNRMHIKEIKAFYNYDYILPLNATQKDAGIIMRDNIKILESGSYSIPEWRPIALFSEDFQ
jgi:tRNA U34 5-carboxymethylaminomethyl modifying GTPase MnmE/TrmE